MDMELTYPGKVDQQTLLNEIIPAIFETPVQYGRTEQGPTNSLYHGDNLPIMRALFDDEKVYKQVKLIYIDPPYSSPTERKFFHREQQDYAYRDEISGYKYIEFMRQRLIVMRELLAEDGSIYVHLDGEMAPHIKVIMDEVFGADNFRNWITRKKCHSKNYTFKQYGNISDYLLFYSRSKQFTWNRPYEEKNIYNLEQRFPKVEPQTGRRYALVPIHAPGTRRGETGKPWRGMSPPPGKHWQVPPAELDRLDALGEIYWSSTGNPRKKIFADRSNGVPVQDIWMSFMDFRNQNMKTTGYPTEKNAGLIHRIIAASSNSGDLVLDCFCGSGTTLDVAGQLGRKWIGVDSSSLAIQTSIERLTAGFGKTEGAQLALKHQQPFSLIKSVSTR